MELRIWLPMATGQSSLELQNRSSSDLNGHNRREPGSTKGFGGVMGIVDLSKLEQSHGL